MYAVFLHAHQKIDKVAYRHLLSLHDKDVFFPALPQIIHFEGRNGPDAAKLKNKENVEQPWHFIDPFDEADTSLHYLISDHYTNLVTALAARDEIRSGFEAAWLAHALVDGLTPAHHYPYEKELEALRGDVRHSRKGLVGRAYVKGDNRRDSLRRSFQLIGPKGLLTTHAMFEGGAYSIMAPMRLKKALPTREDLIAIRQHGIVEIFHRYAREIASYDLYVRFYEQGWTPKLTRDIRRELAPRMVRIVTLSWFAALCDANLIAEPA
ncbi:MAG TPA: hypothetical protein VF575_01975 [Candidatus Saccharimonadales bacterium]|jgi:hypothetical protein